ncbi:hypothetical protein N7462_008639 [Penicillium macrosclerotiorum]|uniref:uncharacterized protein n=1 Tax=Penicillium macrosclerotiorum TaxID=303699 RepID=UPI0025478003|nr:uncharacterized protein N7462_008639 [Penicillium macrosclerotiorum]KAJ5675742.1 hypothetical protein N7462_008639 [Penicillium macrosclerotiorum]
MDPSKPPQDDPPPRPIDNSQNNPAQVASQCDLSDSLNQLSLANAVATPLPQSPSLLTPHDTSSRSSVASVTASQRKPSASSLHDEHRKSIPALHKRPSAASLRSVSQPTGPSGPTSPRAGSSRRSSANYVGPSTAVTSPTMSSHRLSLTSLEMQGPTAATVATDHFQKELALHQVVDLKPKTVVLVHDACYGHRFSRPRTSKLTLGSIVERPERIRACVLGISAAYVRLGRRYAGERFAPHHPDLDWQLLPPPFLIRKTSRSLPILDGAVTNVHGTQWMADLKTMCDVAESRLVFTGKELVRPSTEGKDGPALHSGDLYLCSESLEALQGALGGVCDGIDAVLGPGPTSRAFVCIRPPGHHCSSDFPSGFCWLNNVHVGISYAAMHYDLTHAAILDFDLHHGDGSQEIAWDHNYKASNAPRNAAPYKKTAIGYYSLHDVKSYPCEGGDPDKVRNASVCIDGAHGQSIWNVHLENWRTEADFWKLYETKYIALINKARDFLRAHTQKLTETFGGPTPKAAIFISAGFDASEWESEGMQRHGANVPTEFYARFTADVVRMSQEEGLGVDGRVISVLEGGYSDRALTSGVLSHLAGLADIVAPANEPADNTITPEMTNRLDLPTNTNKSEYDPEWWSPAMLTELEALVSTPQKYEKSTPSFLASTTSFKAKVVIPPRDRKPSSSTIGTELPLPEVDWATAAYVLSRILIPDETRQTMSCRPEDLNAEASRQRRDRQVALNGGINPAILPPPPPPPPEEKRQLRVRKAKSPTPYSPRPATPRQQAMRKNRRTTIDGNDLPDPSTDLSSADLSPSVGASRRKSTSATEPISMGGLNSAIDQAKPAATPVKSAGTRKTSGPRQGTPKRSASPRKAPPVPKLPSGYLPSKLSDEVTVPANDVENLSAGLRKIKLVVPSPEEQAAREKKAAEERKAASKAPKPPKSPRSSRKASGSKIARGKAAICSEVTPSSSPPPLPMPPSDLATSDLIKQEKPSSNFGVASDTPTASSPWDSAAETVDSSLMDISLQSSKPFEWPAPSVPASAFQQTPMSGTNSSPPLTPNLPQNPHLSTHSSNIYSPPTSTSQTKQGLPVLTSSSPIPFSTPENHTTPQHYPENRPHPSSTQPQSYDGQFFPQQKQ